LLREADKQVSTIAEKDKEIKLQQIKLREFLQKNMRDLPLKTFDEIENIMEYNPDSLNEDVYGTKNKGGTQTRRMADTYKRVREIASKYANSDQEMEDMIAKYAVKKELFTRKPSN